MLERWNITHTRITTFHPKANGLVEKQVDVIKRAITTYVNDPD